MSVAARTSGRSQSLLEKKRTKFSMFCGLQHEVGEGPFYCTLQRAPPPHSNFLSNRYSKQHVQKHKTRCVKLQVQLYPPCQWADFNICSCERVCNVKVFSYLRGSLSPQCPIIFICCNVNGKQCYHGGCLQPSPLNTH